MGIADRRAREREQRRLDIIEAAEAVFFSKGLAVATMDDVAEAAELSKGTLYLYFKSKEDLYLAIIIRAMGILTDMFEDAVASQEKGLDKVRAVGRAYFAFSKAHPDHFNAMLFFESYNIENEDESDHVAECVALSTRMFEICAQAVRVGIEDGTIRPGLDPFKTALTLYGVSTGLLQIVSLKGRLIEDHKLEPDAVIETFFDMIERSLRA
jgi:AcrR family transcriptional regulator